MTPLAYELLMAGKLSPNDTAYYNLHHEGTVPASKQGKKRRGPGYERPLFIGDTVMVLYSMIRDHVGQTGVVLDNEAGQNLSIKNALVLLDDGIEAFCSHDSLEVINNWSAA